MSSVDFNREREYHTRCMVELSDRELFDAASQGIPMADHRHREPTSEEIKRMKALTGNSAFQDKARMIAGLRRDSEEYEKAVRELNTWLETSGLADGMSGSEKHWAITAIGWADQRSRLDRPTDFT